MAKPILMVLLPCACIRDTGKQSRYTSSIISEKHEKRQTIMMQMSMYARPLQIAREVVDASVHTRHSRDPDEGWRSIILQCLSVPPCMEGRLGARKKRMLF